MDCVLQPLRDPEHSEGNENDQSDNLASAAIPTGAGGVIAGWLILDVDCDKGDRIPCAESCGDQTADEADQINMTVPLADINRGLEHKCREGNPGYPCVERESEEETEDQEDDAGGPVPPPKIEDGGAQCPANVQDTCDPDELLREEARKPDISV